MYKSMNICGYSTQLVSPCSYDLYDYCTDFAIFFLMQVLKNKPDFRRKPWPNITPAAKDFVQKLLVKDPHARLTAAQALCM